MNKPKYIKGWEDLVGIESLTHYLKIDLDYECGWILPKEDNKEGQDDYIYLSTHTFYGSNFEGSTRILQSYGFNVQLANCDID